MKEIPLTRGYVALVDDEDFDELNKYKWHAHIAENFIYATRKSRGTQIRMHRQILGFPDSPVDHKDHNGVNNCRANLRICTPSENVANSKLKITNTSGFKGVHRKGNKWQATTEFHHCRFHLGYFNTKEDAARAYDVKAKELWGEFAFLNFPDAARASR